MSYTALYRKYRPNNFANVVGQDVVVEVLKNSLKNVHLRMKEFHFIRFWKIFAKDLGID